MIMVPSDYNQADSYTGEANAKLPAGGYVCEIKGAHVESVGGYGNKFVLAIDICEGEQAGFFDRAYQKAKKDTPDARWRGTYETFLLTREGATNPFFKGMVTCIDKSNAPFKTVQDGQINEALLKGKKIGILFREEEYEKNGAVRTVVKAFAARTVEDIRKGVETPAPKRLAGVASKAQNPTAGFTQVDDEELPF